MWLEDEVVRFVTADISGVETHGAYQPALSYHKANIEDILIEDITLSRNEFYVMRIYFSTQWLPPKTTTEKFSS